MELIVIHIHIASVARATIVVSDGSSYSDLQHVCILILRHVIQEEFALTFLAENRLDTSGIR